jgi:hypothetical protein
MEDRPRHPAHVPHHASAAIYGQDVAQLCQPLRIPESVGSQGARVRISLSKYVVREVQSSSRLNVSNTYT